MDLRDGTAITMCNGLPALAANAAARLAVVLAVALSSTPTMISFILLLLSLGSTFDRVVPVRRSSAQAVTEWSPTSTGMVTACDMPEPRCPGSSAWR